MAIAVVAEVGARLRVIGIEPLRTVCMRIAGACLAVGDRASYDRAGRQSSENRAAIAAISAMVAVAMMSAVVSGSSQVARAVPREAPDPDGGQPEQ